MYVVDNYPSQTSGTVGTYAFTVPEPVFTSTVVYGYPTSREPETLAPVRRALRPHFPQEALAPAPKVSAPPAHHVVPREWNRAMRARWVR